MSSTADTNELMVYCLFLLDGSDDGLGWHYYRYCVLNAYITVFNRPKSQYGESGLCFENRKYSCQIDSHWTTHTFKLKNKQIFQSNNY